jgi:hypothetical protein
MRNKRLTREEIRRAILRIEHRRPKRIGKERCRMNISAVAREAGISAASIHNTYQDLAEIIRTKARMGACPSEDRRIERRRLYERLRQARARLKATEKDLIRIASENARLITENAVLRAKLASRNMIEVPIASRRASVSSQSER